MRRVGQARRRDANEQPIVDALCQLGAVVFRLSAPGCPDLLVGWKGKWQPMEVKTADGKLTPLQWGSWGDCAYPIVRTVDDALKAIGVQR
jgi:hypothetical protein